MQTFSEPRRLFLVLLFCRKQRQFWKPNIQSMAFLWFLCCQYYVFLGNKIFFYKKKSWIWIPFNWVKHPLMHLFLLLEIQILPSFAYMSGLWMCMCSVSEKECWVCVLSHPFWPSWYPLKWSASPLEMQCSTCFPGDIHLSGRDGWTGILSQMNVSILSLPLPSYMILSMIFSLSETLASC